MNRVPSASRRVGQRRASRALALALISGAFAALLASCGSDRDRDRDAHADGVGNFCVEDADCPTGECYLGPGGGYCTSPCSEEGDTSECPLDTVCKPIQGGARRCLLICGSDSSCDEAGCPVDFCPVGSSCVSVGGTSQKACEPDPG